MKPGFALDLTHDDISLLHRTAQGWVEVGKANLSDPDLGSMLSMLRRTATGLAPNGFTTKLVLPESQILYLEVNASGPDSTSRRKEILDALEGRTPYRADELVFDWSGSGPRLQVAVVAKVTLEEAETFAETYRFNPVSFVTRPADGTFAGEPFFGLTEAADKYLGKGEKFERDQDPIRILAVAPSREAVDAVATATEPPPETPEAIPEAIKDAPTVEAEAVSEAPDATTPESHPEPEVAAKTEPDSETDTAPDETDAAVAAASDDDEPEESPDAPTGIDAPEDDSATTVGRFQSRRHSQAADVATDTVPEATEPLQDRLGEVTPRLNLTEAEHIQLPEADFVASDVAKGGLGITADQVPLPDGAVEDNNAPAHDPAKAAGLFGRALLKTLPDTRMARPGLKPDTAVVLTRQTKEVLAEFAARRSAIPTDWRKLGLGALAVLALALVVTVLWAMWPSGNDGSSAIRTATPPVFETAQGELAPTGPVVPSSAPGALPEPTIQQATDQAEKDPTIAADAAVDQALREALPELALSAPQDIAPAAVSSPQSTTTPAPVAPDVARDFAGDTVWTNIPERTLNPEVDAEGAPAVTPPTPGPTGLEAVDPTTLAGLSPDAQPSLQPLPPPFGTIIQFSADGLIIPTEDGVVTADGITLIAGRPPRAPEPRPEGIAGQAEPEANPLAGKNPKARPEGLVPVVANPSDVPSAPDATAEAIADQVGDTVTDAVAETPLAAPVDPAHSAQKPRARPQSVLARAAAARATQDAIADAAAATLRGEEAASVLAVASSRRPSARPKSLARAVEAAVAAAVATPPAEPASLEVEIDEPEPISATPNIPTTVTVAKQATVKNAIDLGDVNLIGIYGSSSNRRALVRMPNGKYIKVKLGDRFDGGKVAAIGDSELSYVKNGRTIVLRMPKKG